MGIVILCWAAAAALLLLDFLALPIAGVFALLLFGAGLWRLRSIHDRRRAVRALLVNGALLLASVVFCLAVLEIGARILFGAPAKDLISIARHPESVFTLRPNTGYYEEVVDTGEAIRYDISSQGLRDRVHGSKQPDELRVMLVGDSFTFGHGVELGDTIPQRLESSLNDQLERPVSVINLGVPAYAPWQELIRLREVGLAFEPDLVLLQVFLPNDVQGTLEETGETLDAYDTEWFRRRHYFQLQHYAAVRWDRWLQNNSALYRAIVDRSGRAYWLADQFGWLRGVATPPPMEPPPNAGRVATLEPYLKADYPLLASAFEKLQADILKMRALCREHNIDFAVYLAPPLQEVSEAAWAEAEIAHDQYDRDKPHRRMRDFFQEHDIAHIDLLEPLRNQAHSDALYYKNDGHWTPAGTAEVARVLGEYVANRFASK